MPAHFVSMLCDLEKQLETSVSTHAYVIATHTVISYNY